MIRCQSFIVHRLKLYKFAIFANIYDNGRWITSSPKIVILGSSFAKVHLIPKMIQEFFGYTDDQSVVNCGQSMGGAYEMYITVVKNLRKFEHCEYFFVGLDPHILGEKFYHYMHVEKQLVTLEQWEYLFLHNHSYMAKYHPDLILKKIHPFKMFIDMFRFISSKSEKFNGYEPRAPKTFKTFELENVKEYVFGDLDLFPVSNMQVNYLEKLQKLILNKTNAKIVYILSPSKSWHLGYEKYCQSYDVQLTTMLQKHLGNITIVGSLFGCEFKFYDFSDDRHLSHFGAVKFTKVFLDTYLQCSPASVKPLSQHKMIQSDKCYLQNHFIKTLSLMQRQLKLFTHDQNKVVIFGFTNASRIICSLLDSNIQVFICDDSSFLKTMPQYLVDMFVKPKNFFHIGQINNFIDDQFIIGKFIDFKKNYDELIHLGINQKNIFGEMPIDYEYLQMQIHMFFALIQQLQETKKEIILIGRNVLYDFLVEFFGSQIVLKKAFIDCVSELNDRGWNQSSVYIILDEQEAFEIENRLKIDYNISIDDIIIFDL